MSVLAAPQAGRLVRISLRDVPLHKRKRAARALLDAAARQGDLMEAVRITRAYLCPSGRLYVVSEQAVREVLG